MALAAIAAGSTPATAEIVPSSASSPSATKSPSWSPGQRAKRGHEGEGDRQIVVAALLGQVGRREVDDDPARRQRQAAGVERRLYPVAALRHRLVGQADDAEIGLTRRDLHLDIDRHRLDALKRNGRDV